MKIVKELQSHYPGLKMSRFPRSALDLDFEKDILPNEKKLIEHYGFVKEEVNFIVKHRPSFIVMGKDDKVGMEVLYKFFVEKKGYDIDTLRTLVVKYPYIAGKDEQHLAHYFSIMNDYGVSDDEAMTALL